MHKDDKQVTNIQGNVEKFTQIDTVNGQVTIKSESAVIQTMIEPVICHYCGMKDIPNKNFFECKRCQKTFCLEHKPDSGVPFCLNCVKLIDLEKLLSDPEDDKRFRSAQLLCAEKDFSTIPALKHQLEIEANPFIRNWLAIALGKIGGENAYKILLNAQTREKDDFALLGIQDALNEIKASKAKL